MPSPRRPKKPRWDQPVGRPEMLSLCAEEPNALADLLERVSQGLQAERSYVATCLEERHQILLAHLAESCCTGTTAYDSKIGNAQSVPSRICSEGSRSFQQTKKIEFTADHDIKDDWREMQVPRSQSVKRLISTNSKEKLLKQSTAQTLDKDQIERRLHARLGYYNSKDLVPAEAIHAAATSLSFEDFCLDEIRGMISDLCGRFQETPSGGVLAMLSGRKSVRKSGVAWSNHASVQGGKPVWTGSELSIQFDCFVEALGMDEQEMLPLLGEENQAVLIRLRNTLLCSDKSCMVAEILNLRADDVLNKQPTFEIWQLMEPFFAVCITLNAILIGLSTNSHFKDQSSMFVVELSFTVIFTLELIVRIWFAKNCRTFLCGNNKYWHFLDMLTVFFGWMDICLRGIPLFEPEKFKSALSIMRLAKFTKFFRLLRSMRPKFLTELTLMIEGLAVGARTLLWGVVLLLFVLYSISIFLTLSVGQDERSDDFDQERRDHFSTLSRTWFTTFRCTLVVDCGSSSGPSLLILARRRYGWGASVGYAVFFLIVNLGLMNLIMAVFVENTMRQAQRHEHQARACHNQESFRVAQQLKQVLLKICQVALTGGRQSSKTILSKTSELGRFINHAEITREDFLLALHDESLQVLMDDLDIPPERSHLFDVLDADGSGRLDALEILDGLLKVRGEPRSSDTVASWLAIRALQKQVRGIGNAIRESHDGIVTAILQDRDVMGTWDV